MPAGPPASTVGNPHALLSVTIPEVPRATAAGAGTYLYLPFDVPAGVDRIDVKRRAAPRFAG